MALVFGDMIVIEVYKLLLAMQSPLYHAPFRYCLLTDKDIVAPWLVVRLIFPCLAGDLLYLFYIILIGLGLSQHLILVFDPVFFSAK